MQQSTAITRIDFMLAPTANALSERKSHGRELTASVLIICTSKHTITLSENTYTSACYFLADLNPHFRCNYDAETFKQIG